MKLFKLSLLFAVALFVPAAAHADACPALTGANSFYYAGITTTHCNTILTINPDGTATITFPNTNPYDGNDDDYVGVINNSGGTVMAITLSGPGIFGFDGDGIDGYGIPGNAVDLAAYGAGAYGGQDATFSGIGSGSTGVVNFIGGIATGGTGYFSLENPPTAGGLVTGPIIIVSSTPEPSSLILLGSGVLALAGAVRRRLFRP